MNVAQRLRVFWQPGCSSCVKVKEFLTELGVEYESVNVLSDPKGFADLEALGAQSVPVVSRGHEFVFAQSLSDVAKFVGRDVALERLPPEKLIERWFYFLNTSKAIVADIPADRLEYHPVAKRSRTLRDLGYHIYQVPDAFLLAVEEGKEDLGPIHENAPAEVTTIPHVLKYADSVIQRLDRWWANLNDKSCAWSVGTYYGVQPATHLLERSTWHSAQHARQLLSAIEALGVNATRRIDVDAYKGLPMPVTIWE